MNKHEIYEMNKEKRGQTGFRFNSKIPQKNGVFEVMVNGRLYHNSNKKLLIKDIETIENG